MTAKSRRGDASAPARSDAFEAIHSAASSLHRAGSITKATMREYDALCLTPVKSITAREVVLIRTKANVSQNLFARYLNTSESTVQKWEAGAKKPGALATKLLRVVEKFGLEVLG
jgi:putative transcriptional regulator